jgi:hypothetical protein
MFRFPKEDCVSHFQRVSCVLGTLLVGVSAFLIFSERRSVSESRRHPNTPPVEDLAQALQEAWSGYHNR